MRIHAFDGVAEHGAWHFLSVLFEKDAKNLDVFLAYFAEHPAASFVHEVVFFGEEELAEFEGVNKISLANEKECRDDCNTFFPEVF